MKIRLADQDDIIDVYEWRNDSLAISMSESGREVEFGEHVKWFLQALLDPTQLIFIAEDGGNKIGICRFKHYPDNFLSVVSINLNPRSRGRHLGFIFLSESINKYRAFISCALNATINNSNHASIKIFKKCKFECTRVGEYFSLYELKSN